MKLISSYVLGFFLMTTMLFTSCGKSKSDMLVGDWKVTEFDLSGTKLTGDQVGMSYSFKEDGKFSRVEDGKEQTGSYSLGEDGKTLKFSIDDQGLEFEKTIEDLGEKKMILSGEEFTMQQTLTMEKI